MTPTKEDVQAAYMAWLRFEMDATIGPTAGGPFFKAKREAYDTYIEIKRQWEKEHGEWNT